MDPSHVAGTRRTVLSYPDCATLSVMPTVSLKAHYDGKTIRLDEPFDLPPNTRLIVTVLPPMTDTDREDWSNLAVANLARAYGDDEPEYSVTNVRGR